MLFESDTFPFKFMGKVSDSKNIVTELVYFCSYPYGTTCTKYIAMSVILVRPSGKPKALGNVYIKGSYIISTIHVPTFIILIGTILPHT